MTIKRNQAVTPNSETDKTGGEKKSQKKAMKVLNTVINVVLIIAIVLAALCTYVSFVSSSGSGAPNIFGFQFLSIQTDSMYPTFNPGDLIIDKDIYTDDAAKEQLKRGDVITYWTNINGERVLNTHRIANVYDGGGYRIFETIGDKNTVVDTLTVHESEVVGVYLNVTIPGVGKALDYLQTSTGFLLVVVIPVFIFFIYHLVQFFRVLFEYQNIKNRIKYEQERDAQDAAAEQKNDEEEKAKERAALEAELREKLRAEILESMAHNKEAAAEEPKASDSDSNDADGASNDEIEEKIEEKDEAESGDQA